jgi:hypothetical protein
MGTTRVDPLPSIDLVGTRVTVLAPKPQPPKHKTSVVDEKPLLRENFSVKHLKNQVISSTRGMDEDLVFLHGIARGLTDRRFLCTGYGNKARHNILYTSGE